jgi:predicted AAA+ superfamily ATPase
LAGRVGQLVNNSTLATEVGVSSTTIGSWLSVLEASHVIYTLKPWFKNRNSQVVKTPKIYFCDTGLVSYLLGIETPEQMIRDPLLGNIFENFVVIEALKTRLNLGLEPNLYFFRNSNGLEIDLILLEQNKLKLFEIKSGKSLNDEFCRNMKNFFAKYNEDILSTSTKGTVIYSGETYESYKDFGFYNFSNIPQLFESKTQTFRLNF